MSFQKTSLSPRARDDGYRGGRKKRRDDSTKRRRAPRLLDGFSGDASFIFLRSDVMGAGAVVLCRGTNGETQKRVLVCSRPSVRVSPMCMRYAPRRPKESPKYRPLGVPFKDPTQKKRKKGRRRRCVPKIEDFY